MAAEEQPTAGVCVSQKKERERGQLSHHSRLAQHDSLDTVDPEGTTKAAFCTVVWEQRVMATAGEDAGEADGHTRGVMNVITQLHPVVSTTEDTCWYGPHVTAMVDVVDVQATLMMVDV